MGLYVFVCGEGGVSAIKSKNAYRKDKDENIQANDASIFLEETSLLELKLCSYIGRNVDKVRGTDEDT